MTISKMKPCKFTFDDETVYDGFAHGSTWNGFDNVAVTLETLTKICHDAIAASGDESGADEFRGIKPMKNGLYSLGWGFTTQIVERTGESR